MITHVVPSSRQRRKRRTSATSTSKRSGAEGPPADVLFDAHVSGTETAYEDTGRSKGKHVEFVIQVTERHSWRVSQRYSAFEALHKTLLKYFPQSALPELPAKRFLRSFDPGYLRKKQANLQAYLKALVAVPGIMQHAAVQQFLLFSEHSRFVTPQAPLPAQPTLLAQPVVAAAARPAAASPAVTAAVPRKVEAQPPVPATTPTGTQVSRVHGGRKASARQSGTPGKPTRVSTAVCRAAAERAKGGTTLGVGLHVRCLQRSKDDPVVCAMYQKQQRVDLSKSYDDADDLLDAVATHAKAMAFLPATGTKILILEAEASEADSDVDGSNTSVVHLTGFTIVNGNRSRVSATLRSDSLTGRVAIGAAPLPATDVRAHALDELSSVM